MCDVALLLFVLPWLLACLNVLILYEATNCNIITTTLLVAGIIMYT